MFTIPAAVLATLLVVVVLRNLGGGEKQIERQITRLYAARDPAFVRAMGIALGPNVVAGNRIETLLNGDQIFPSMLQAIRGAIVY